MATPRVIESAEEFRAWRAGVGSNSLGFVPTMGGLHEGHASLIRRSASECDRTAVSIFVNPLQFGAGEDFEKYPRTLEADLQICGKSGADVVFLGTRTELYPSGFETHVEPGPLADVLCGSSRPGHFRGVLTVVAKLFGIVQPGRAYFGRKDFQQCVLISRMVADLNMPVEVVHCPTVREPDGLAMSTRNSYLSPLERKQALCLWQAISAAQAAFQGGERNPATIRTAAASVISTEPAATVDYIELVDPATLRTPEVAGAGSVLALAVRIGAARLIDNAPMVGE